MTTGLGNKTRTRVTDTVEHVTTLSFNEFAQFIIGLQKGRFATFEAITVPKMRKTNNPHFGHVVKVAKAQVRWNVDYGNTMNAQRVRDGLETRDVKPRKWGVHLADTPFVFHVRKGETTPRLYVRMDIIRSLGYVYLDQRTGETIDNDIIHGFMSTPKKTEIVWREYGIETITKITAEGQTYTIAHDFGVPSHMLAAANAALAKANEERKAEKARHSAIIDAKG